MCYHFEVYAMSKYFNMTIKNFHFLLIYMSVDDKALSENYNCKNWTYFSICHWGVIVEMESFETWIYSLQFMTTKIWDPE